MVEDDSDGVEGSGFRHAPVSSVERHEQALVVRLTGELDLYNAAALRAALLEATGDAPERVVLDLAAVRFIDSTTLGVLVEARKRLASGTGFMLAAPPLETRRALEVSGLDRVFSVHDTVENALAATI